MSLIKKALLKYAVITANMTGYTLQKLLAMNSLAEISLSNGWNESAYNDLEEARKLAEKENYWFEELLILLNEVQCLINCHNDRDLFYAANFRLKELHKVFDMPDDIFKSTFEENYINGKIRQIQEQTFECLAGMYDILYKRGDKMAAHMNLLAAILCSKAMGKIEMLTGCITLKKRMERLFKLANDYGNIREMDEAMLYYNEAIKVAREENDMTYEYIALIRKLSICIGIKHISTHINVDSETMSAVMRLYEMCDSTHPDPYLLGEKLVKAEQDKAENGTKTVIDEAKWRIDRLRESMPVLPLQLALSRGDWQTARIYADELKEKELEAYGSCCDFSNSDLLMPLYEMLYNSEERKEEVEEISDDGESVDEPYRINFPDKMLPIDKHRYLIIQIRNEILQKHQLSAEELGKQAEEIALAVNSDYHMAMALHAIAQAYESTGNNEVALTKYQEVVKMLTKNVHPGSDVTLSKSLLYNTLLEIGVLTKNTNPKESIDVLSDAIALLKNNRNDDTLFLKHALLERSIAMSNIGNIEGKENDCKAALDLILNDSKKRLPFIDKEFRENYWAEVSTELRQVVAQLDENCSPSLRLAVYDAVLMAKGFLLSSEKAETEAIYNEESLREYIPLHKELEAYEASKLPWGTMTENSAGKYVEHYMKTMKLQMATNGVIEKYYDFMHIKFHDITEVLNKNNDVVLDYYDYPLEDGDQQYVAFVYGKGMEAPKFVKVCKESDLQKIYQEVAANKYDDGTPFHVSEAYNSTRKYSAQLFNLILNGVLKHTTLSQDSRIYFVPSGSLYKVPVESLIVEEGTATIVSDLYPNFNRISHVRTLANSADCKLDSIGLFGGLNYGEVDSEETHTRGYVIGMNERAATPLVPWGELKQTRTEVKNISFLWQMANKVNCEIHTELEGTPEKLKELSENGCSVLHLATHGFFETMSSKVNIPCLHGAYRPMDLTGLVMSNGNEGWLHGNILHHEGILTASDIAKLDLSHTQLVILSACYTGEGVVRSDGVYGLQRAFKKAGAGCLVMSLWNESDAVGSDFMTMFHSYLRLENFDRRKAFNLAKTEVRKKFPHPLFWANFIMID